MNRYNEEYDEKADIYAFGMVILEIITREYPYIECNNIAQIYRCVTNGQKPLALNSIPKDKNKSFILLCLSFSPADRPTAKELQSNQFFVEDEFEFDKDTSRIEVTRLDTCFRVKAELRFDDVTDRRKLELEVDEESRAKEKQKQTITFDIDFEESIEEVHLQFFLDQLALKIKTQESSEISEEKEQVWYKSLDEDGAQALEISNDLMQKEIEEVCAQSYPDAKQKFADHCQKFSNDKLKLEEVSENIAAKQEKLNSDIENLERELKDKKDSMQKATNIARILQIQKCQMAQRRQMMMKQFNFEITTPNAMEPRTSSRTYHKRRSQSGDSGQLVGSPTGRGFIKFVGGEKESIGSKSNNTPSTSRGDAAQAGAAISGNVLFESNDISKNGLPGQSGVEQELSNSAVDTEKRENSKIMKTLDSAGAAGDAVIKRAMEQFQQNFNLDDPQALSKVLKLEPLQKKAARK
eukprot:UC4_evm7s1393